MENKVKEHFESVFNILIENKKIIFPPREIIIAWQKVIDDWITDKSIPLFVRKGSQTRGTKIELNGRNIITTDNTPAHWIFKNLVLENLNFNSQDILELINTNKFPISFIRKKQNMKRFLMEWLQILKRG